MSHEHSYKIDSEPSRIYGRLGLKGYVTKSVEVTEVDGMDALGGDEVLHEGVEEVPSHT